MGINKSASQLKQAARGILLGNYGKAISLTVFSNLVISTITLMVNQSESLSAGALIINYLSFFLITLISCIFQVGLYTFYLNTACKKEAHFKDLFTGFFLYPDKTIASQLLIQLLSFLCFLPGASCMFIYYFKDNSRYALVSLILIFLGIPFYLWVNLSFSQCYFILLDFPDTPAMELLRKSAALMKGSRLRLFFLQLSFLPMIILGLLSFGIGLLFLYPYQSMAYTLFYLSLVQEN